MFLLGTLAILHLQPVQDDLRWVKTPLKSAEQISVDAVHPNAAVRLFEQNHLLLPGTPAASVRSLLTDRIRRGKKGNVEVDPDGLGEDWKSLKPGKTPVHDWFASGRTERLQFFERDGSWWCCSANLLATSKADTPVTLWDANADGDYLDPCDLLRFGDGVFHPVGAGRTADSGAARWRIRLEPSRSTARLSYAVLDPVPEGATPAQRRGFEVVNRSRNQHGFGPASYSEDLSDALMRHTAYLQHHDPNKEGTLESYMGEETGRALYSEDGDAASRGGNVAYLTNQLDTEAHLGSILNMTHSRLNLFIPGEPRFGYGHAQAWSFVRLDATPGDSGAPYWVVPGAGAQSAPTTCGRNWPYPQSYPTLYDEPRGLPISIQIPSPTQPDGSFLTVRTLGLTAVESGKRIGGFYFSIDDIPTGNMSDTWFFVPAAPLALNTEFLAQAVIEQRRSSEGNEGILVAEERIVWSFKTSN